MNYISIKKNFRVKKRLENSMCLRKDFLFYVHVYILDFKTGQQYLLLIFESFCNSVE